MMEKNYHTKACNFCSEGLDKEYHKLHLIIQAHNKWFDICLNCYVTEYGTSKPPSYHFRDGLPKIFEEDDLVRILYG